MITRNGREISLTINPKDTAASKWAKDAADRIFSHYTDSEMEAIRKRNGEK